MIKNLCCCALINSCILFAPTEWKSPTAGLQPGSPENLFPSHLVLNVVHICAGLWSIVGGCHFLWKSAPMSHYGFGSPLKDFSITRFSIWSQGAGLRGVMEKIKQERRVVVRHVLTMAKANLCVIASTSSRWREVWGEEVHFEDWIPWIKHTHILKTSLSG